MKTTKNTITVLLAICMIAALLTVNVFAAGKEPVTYKAYTWADIDLLSAAITEENYFEVTPETTVFESNEVYVVNGTVTVADRIECGQNVKLVLTDDSVLNTEKGIHVTGSLEIYGGTKGNGTLNSAFPSTEKTFSNLGINKGETACNISVHGGILNLKHDGYVSCIDAGSGSFSQYAGKIEGHCYNENGVKAGTIDVYGGEMSCVSEIKAGITGDTVTIYGGELDCKGCYGAGVEGKKITINEGIVMADSVSGAAVGSGEGDTSNTAKPYVTSCDSITINGGYVSVESYSGAGIGSGESGSCGTITLNNGSVACVPRHGGAIGSGVAGVCKTVNINGGSFVNIFAEGYAFRGAAEFKKSAGTMPEVHIGNGVTIFYGQTGDELNSRNQYVTSSSRDISKTLKDQKYIAVVQNESLMPKNAGTTFSVGSVTLIIACGTLLLGAAVGLLLGKKLFSAKK